MKTPKRNLVTISVCVSPAELKKLKKAKKDATEPSLSNHCRTILRDSTK